jgi:hypothetical protein
VVLSSNLSLILLIINSILLTGLILSQNDVKQNTQNIRSTMNPLAKITWVSTITQILLLLIQLKVTES